ncbi:hypothetical protein M409DRAFT_20104 [Zasmidium cellare ATCC 36951]|uniref:Uncharacterized protein n=1 Tax=Zasmidium cellare ATCC 36951 TaxID=1080233 RepID=A0A6A6CV52_ZASCE|nr:uncharacterized protein M409DRAFT_20104 [Zasmidium cellare ATCC 36951]KAF2169689.1 hypothetical protein M409DRAFT_20104 [Zasmidium cellare ATCC 36951]
MSRTSDAKADLPDLNEVYKLYEDDHLEDFIEAADILLEQDACLSRCDTIQLLIFASNSVEEPRDTLDYFQRAEEELRFWQVNHARKDIPTIEILGEKVKALEDVVKKDRIEREKAQQDAEDEKFEASGHGLQNPGLMQDRVANMEEDENEPDTNEGPAAGDMQSENLVFRPKKKPSKFQTNLRRKSLKSQKSLSGLSKKEPEPEHGEKNGKKSEGLR